MTTIKLSSTLDSQKCFVPNRELPRNLVLIAELNVGDETEKNIGWVMTAQRHFLEESHPPCKALE